MMEDKSIKTISEQLLSYRRELMGFAITWVMVFHLFAKLLAELKTAFLYQICSCGYIGVDIFLFLSGGGLYYSLSKGGTVKDFYGRRIKRFLMPWLILAFPYWILKTIIADHGGLLDFSLNLSGASFWMHGITTTWYCAFSVVMYLIYPAVFLIQKKRSQIILLMIGFSYLLNIILIICAQEYFLKVEIATQRIPVFLLGSYIIGTMKEKTFSKRTAIGIGCYTFVTLVMFTAGKIMENLSSICVPGPMTLFLVRSGGLSVALILICFLCFVLGKFKMNLIRAVLNFLGNITLELYLLWAVR